MRIEDKVGTFFAIVLIIALAAFIMAGVALVQENPLPINDVNDVNDTLVTRVNSLENSLLDLEVHLLNNQERLENISDDLHAETNSLREELGLTNTEISLIFLRDKIMTENNIEDLSDEVLSIRNELYYSFEISPPTIPPNFEDIDMVFNNLEREINQGDEDESIYLIDVIFNKMRTNIDLTIEEACETAGGEWIEFTDACVDNCYTQDACAQALTYGCDCGEDMCWNGLDCQEQ